MKKYIFALSTMSFLMIALGQVNNKKDWREMLDYSTLQPPPPSVVIFEPEAHKKIVYAAVEHVSNLKHPVVQKIKEIIESQTVDFCILEGFNPEDGINPRRILDGAEPLIAQKKCPENLYAAYWCCKHGIDFIGGDIHNAKYLEPLAQKGFSQKDIVFWMLAQNFPFWNREKIVSNQNFKELAHVMIHNNITFWLNKPRLEHTVEEFLEWHEHHMGKPLDVVNDFPWGYDKKEFMPSLAENATIYQKIQAYIMPLRDVHIIEMIQNAVQKYDTVLVIFGASHYEWQKSALAYLFGKPKQRITI